MKIKYFIVFILLFCLEKAYTQNIPDFNGNLKVEAPKLGGLEKYVTYPVSLHTGVPDITIPIFSINLKGLNYPISIKYHASGIKMNDPASVVGLGWSLDANGAVSVQANGKRDDLSGFNYQHPMYSKIKNRKFVDQTYGDYSQDCSVVQQFYNPELPFNGNYELYDIINPEFLYFKSIIYNYEDSQPDMYTFFSPTISGKFFSDEHGVYRTIPATNTKIQNLNGFNITDDKGNTYYFDHILAITSISESPCNLNIYGNYDEPDIVYELSKIVTVHGEQINFVYNSWTTGSYRKTDQFSKQSRLLGEEQTVMNTSGCKTTTTVTGSAHALDSIYSTNGTIIKFKYSASANNKSLDSIIIKHQNIVIKRFDLRYGYFESSSTDENDYRLKLLGVHEGGKEPYLFDYNPLILPSRLTYSIDHWGYYNGKSNATLLPDDEYMGFANGANRNVDSNYVQAGTLTKVTYPTGGYTKYSYEPNTYWQESPIVKHNKVYSNYLYSVPDQTVSYTFTVPPGSSRLTIQYSNNYDNAYFNNDLCSIHVTNSNGYSKFFYNKPYSEEVLNIPGGGAPLGPATYTVSIETVGSTFSGYTRFFWFADSIIAPHNEIGGGLRIKNIQSFNANNSLAYSKRYEYKQPGTNKSSGISIFTLDYLEPQDYMKVTQVPNQSCGCLREFYITNILHSQSRYPLGYSNGNSVAYSNVIEFDNDKIYAGYTENKFIVSTHSNAGEAQSAPYTPLLIYDWVNGKPIEVSTYKFEDGIYKPVSKTINTYNYTEFDRDNASMYLYTAYGMKIGARDAPGYCPGCCIGGAANVGLYPISFNISFFNYYSSFHYLSSIQEITYNSNLPPVTTNKEFFYDNSKHLYNTRTVTTNSDGKVLTMQTLFPDDYPAGNHFLDDLKATHNISQPVEQVYYQNDGASKKLLAGQILKYFTGGKGLVDTVYKLQSETGIPLSAFKFSNSNLGQLPASNTYNFAADSRYIEQACLTYDSNGNVLTVLPKNGVCTSYKWGYDQQLATVECRNALPTEFYYENFEEIANGILGIAHTGRKYSNMSVINWTKPNLRSYVISYWYLVADEWKYSGEQLYSGNSFTMTGSSTSAYDDVRIYPKDAHMITYTYEPLVGMTSMTDAKGLTTNYIYDELQRLIQVKDGKGNIVTQYCYNYAGQQTNCSAVLPNWRNTASALRCKQIGSSQNTGEQEQEQKDINPVSPTFNQTRWIVVATNITACPLPQPNWQNTSTVVRCKQNGSNQNTGEQEQEQKDLNAASPTYNQTRWVVVATNTTSCPLPQANNCATCYGADYKCINGVCEQGVKVYTDSIQDSEYGWSCYYHYEFSDGSWTRTYVETSPGACTIAASL